MSDFFASTRPGRTVNHGSATFELPILYFRDDLFTLFFSADLAQVKAAMPSDKLHPVRLSSQKALVAAFNYIDTSIGPYGEIGVVIPAVYGDKLPLPVLPGLLETRYPGFGALVMHLPVTKTVARDAGRGEWGYTKFVADMRFTNTPEFQQCEMSEEDRHILTLRVERRGIVRREKKPLITYSVKDGNLIKTVIPQKGTYRMCFSARHSFLKLGDHEVAQSIREWGISAKPLLSRYFVERGGILPAGEIIEENVRPLDGYFGKEREGEHTVSYLAEGVESGS